MSNTDFIEISAPTVEQAISEALETLGAAEDDVAIEVLATPRSGVLGLGARAAKVRVERKAPPEARSGVAEPPPAPKAAPRRQPKPQAASKPSAPPEPQAEAAPKAEKPRRVDKSPQPQADEVETVSGELSTEEGADAERRTAEIDEQVREASSILEQILELMGEKAEVTSLDTDPESIELEIKGDGSGILIGRHGQTLDSLEYLVNRVVARRIRDALPIILDTEAYRARRRQQLERMALSMGERAKREHEPVRLDPMPPRDRRIIHLALKDDPLVNTHSSGDGFLRSVEIVPTEMRRERSGRGGGGGGKRPRERERESERSAIGEQGGFKHGQKKLI